MWYILIIKKDIMKRFDYYTSVLFCAIIWFILLYLEQKELALVFFGILTTFFGKILTDEEKK